MLDKRILRNHDHLSTQCGELTRDLCADEHAHAFQVDLAAAGLPRFLAEYAYPVSPWPLLISSAVKATFANIVREAPSLIGRAILRFYERGLTALMCSRADASP